MNSIKSASIILQKPKPSNEVLLCKRSQNVSFFPGFWVFPGGKIEEELNDNWSGIELEVYDTIFKEMYEEIGIIPGYPITIEPKDRSQNWLTFNYDTNQMKEFKENLIYLGKKQTPPFRPKLYNAAYFLIKHDMLNTFDPVVDGEELVECEWILPEIAIEEWESGAKKIPPPILHLLRNLVESPDHVQTRTLIETELPIGLQTKVEFAPGYQLIPFESNTIPPFYTTNLTIIENNGEILIVDPGAKKDKHQHLREILLSLQAEPTVFITHHHRDHWDGLSVVEEIYPNSVLLAHPTTLKRITTELNTKAVEKETITIGDKHLKIVDAPGHTDSHQVIFEENSNILVAGDHVVGYGSAVLDPSNGNMKQYFETTKKLIGLKPELILPAHGPPNFRGTKLLEYYLKHRQDREDSILAAINNGHIDLNSIVREVYQDVDQKMREYAKRNIQLHIEKLKEENKVPDEL